MLCDKELGVIAVIALDPHDERVLTEQGSQRQSQRSVETRRRQSLTLKRQSPSLLHNQKQPAKATKNGRGDKSIENTQSQQFTVEHLL